MIKLVFFVLLAGYAVSGYSKSVVRKFPEGFTFGCATSSYQVEGAWDEDGKSESIWDHITHRIPSPIKDNSTGDIANDSFHNYKRDVEMMRELGLDSFRFSLSWPRILPTGFPDQINQAAVDYYDNIINEMLKYNITPMVTIYHWDLPQKLQELGGWTNPFIVDWYADYAEIVFSLFGDRVKMWNTINEPYQICYLGYGDELMAPLLNMKGVADYMCSRNLLLAHAKAWRLYDEKYRSVQGGNIFIVYSAQWYEPTTESDVEAAEDANQFFWGLYVHPIYSQAGDYPPVVKQRIAEKSLSQGFPRSRLPELSPEEVDYIRGTSDFLGLNHYTTYLVYRNESAMGYYESPSFRDDMDLVTYQLPEWTINDSGFTKYRPSGFYNLLTKIREDYGNPPIYITENGFASLGGLEDDDRITYFREYLGAMLDAVDEGSDIRAYIVWSLMDNFEWMQGYVEKFGLYEVDYSSPLRTRTPRKSAFVYKQIVKTRSLDPHYEPDVTVMTIGDDH